jgi:predicted CXXCH cytochrome family protein
MLMLGASIVCATALSAQTPAKKVVASAAPAGNTPAGATFVGSDTCATCHDAVAKGFADNPHTKMPLMHGNAPGVTCENCHGAGSEHVAGGGDVTKIFNPSKHSNKEVNETCLKCHASTHQNFQRSPHARADVGCINCHSIHGADAAAARQTPFRSLVKVATFPISPLSGEDKEKLLKAPAPALCFQCHNDVKPQFDMPFHHKVNEGAVNCTDCHDPHGTFGNNNLRSTADQNMICTKCHQEKRGPFIYEHAAVKGEGCLACHTPHGSQNARLLNLANIDTLCAQCHSMVATNTIHNFSWSQSSDVSPCVNCHTMVHGSNLDPAFLR